MKQGQKGKSSKFTALNREVTRCRRCQRLVDYREGVKVRASYEGQDYWRRPITGFGDLQARLLVLGIAPAAHGGNRTGRVFTGDESGRFLVCALHKAGFANKPVSESRDDGLVYTDCYVTAAVKCAPPGDRPTLEEFANCAGYLDVELALLGNVRAVLALGGLAFAAFLRHARRMDVATRGMRFGHGVSYSIQGLPRLWASYHPSPRNTNTGKLTQKMLVAMLLAIRKDMDGLSTKRRAGPHTRSLSPP
ncbi:MAG: uracil-DNA glycosylase [Nitrososphaerales archaeon]|nr:uracil-DNA glycosylase [Nitrososphaerales archaeon]